MRKRPIAVVLAVGVVAFAVYAISTGGLAVSRTRGFGGQRDIELVAGLTSDVWLAPQDTRLDIPFVFHYYGAKGPYGLRLQIWDEGRTYASIEITEIRMEYVDGEVVRMTEKWSRTLRPYTQHNSSSSGIIKTEMFMLSDTIPHVVLRHAHVTVTLRGHLTTTTGKRVDFSVSESFGAQSQFHVTTYWEVLASC